MLKGVQMDYNKHWIKDKLPHKHNQKNLLAARRNKKTLINLCMLFKTDHFKKNILEELFIKGLCVDFKLLCDDLTQSAIWGDKSSFYTFSLPNKIH